MADRNVAGRRIDSDLERGGHLPQAEIAQSNSATTPDQGSARFKHRFTNRGRPDVSATNLQTSSAMPGCALSLQACAFVGGGTALYLH